MDKKPLLSICIPTCNRAEYLQKCLESLICQPEFSEGEVEVVISDNASADHTQQVGERYAAAYENIYYFRNPKSVEDQNFPIVLSRASGVLRKLVNDYLLFRSGSLAYLLGIAAKYAEKKPHLFFLNTREREGFRFRERTVDFERFMRQVSFHITWIGSFAAWDTECQDLTADLAGCALRLWQTWKLCRVFEENNSGVVLYRKIMDNQPLENKLITYDYDQVFYKNYLAVLEPSVEKGLLSRSCIEKLEKDLLYNFFTGWMTKWELHAPQYTFTQNRDFKRKILELYRDKPYYRRYLYFYRLHLAVTRYKLYGQSCKKRRR